MMCSVCTPATYAHSPLPYTQEQWSAEAERKESSILLGKAPRNQSFTTKIIAAKHKLLVPARVLFFSQIWGEEHQPCWISWCTHITFIELHIILGVLLYPWCVHFVSCLAWEAPSGTEHIWLRAGLLPFLPAREGCEKLSAFHVSVVQSLAKKPATGPAPVLVLPGAARGFPTGPEHDPLWQTQQWKHQGQVHFSSNSGQILPLHTWSFNLWASVPFLTIFHLKTIKTINTQCFQGENSTQGRVLVFWSKKVQCWDGKALGR